MDSNVNRVRTVFYLPKYVCTQPDEERPVEKRLSIALPWSPMGPCTACMNSAMIANWRPWETTTCSAWLPNVSTCPCCSPSFRRRYPGIRQNSRSVERKKKLGESTESMPQVVSPHDTSNGELGFRTKADLFPGISAKLHARHVKTSPPEPELSPRQMTRRGGEQRSFPF